MKKSFAQTVLSAFFLTTILVNAQPSLGAVWTATNAWTQEVEKSYAEFVANLSADFFSNPGSRFPVLVKNETLPHALRLVFAYQNSLPAAIRSKLDSRAYLTQDSILFDRFAEGDLRFIEFLKSVLANDINSDSIKRDTFPVGINRDALQPGVVFHVYEPARDMNFHHAQVVRSIDEFGFMTYFQGRARPLAKTLLTRAQTIVEQPDNHDGYVAFRWPLADPRQGLQDHLDDVRYSREQYRNEFWPEAQNTFGNLIANRLSTQGEVPVIRMLRHEIKDLCLHVTQRVEWVNDALTMLEQRRALDPTYTMKRGTPEYGQYSTPTRDQEIRSHFATLTSFGLSNAVIVRELNDASLCTIVYNPEAVAPQPQSMTLATYALRANASKLSANPNDPLERRWGE